MFFKPIPQDSSQYKDHHHHFNFLICLYFKNFSNNSIANMSFFSEILYFKFLSTLFNESSSVTI